MTDGVGIYLLAYIACRATILVVTSLHVRLVVIDVFNRRQAWTAWSGHGEEFYL